jgi:hypothetical protein
MGVRVLNEEVLMAHMHACARLRRWPHCAMHRIPEVVRCVELMDRTSEIAKPTWRMPTSIVV